MALVALWGGIAAASTHHKTAAKASTKKAPPAHSKHSSSGANAKHSSSTKQTSAHSTRGSSHSKSSAHKKGGHAATSSESARRMRQQAPTPERYRQIQAALASRGYFGGEANGSWGTDSVAALKRFQQEQNLTPTGKLDSVSLIALGLGPKRNNIAQTNPQTPQTRPPDDHRRSEGSERP